MQFSSFQLSFERLMDEISEGITLTDPHQPDNPLVYVNSAFCKLSGYAQDEVLGRNCRFLQGPQTDQGQLEILRSAMRDVRPCIVDIINHRKDGSTFWNSLSISPVSDESGQLLYFIGVQTDITLRRKLEERQKQFVGDMAHELKTPLAAILGLTETLTRQPDIDNTTRSTIYGSLLRQSERLHLTVNDILDLNRLSTEATGGSMQVLDFADIVRDSMLSFRAQADIADIELTAGIDNVKFNVMGDAWSLSTMVGNLLGNAIKYSPAGSQIRINLDLADNDTLMLSVLDNGPGIDPEHHERIFERFYRVEASRTRDKGGSGIGLAIVQEVAQRHRGHVLLTSKPGIGSCFRVILPKQAD